MSGRQTTRATPFYSGASYNIDDSYGFLLRQLYASIQHHVERRVQPHDLTAMQWAPLLLLEEGKADTCADLAACTHSHNSSRRAYSDRSAGAYSDRSAASDG